jgi:chromosome segregation ATPase
LSQATATIRVLRETIASQKASIGEKVREIAAIQAEADEQQRTLSDRADAEKTRITAAHDATVKELQTQADLQRKDIQKLTEKLSNVEKRLKSAKTEIFELRQEGQKRERNSEVQEKQVERERKLQEATARAALLKTESEYAARLEECKAAVDRDKRKICAFIADAFKQYFGSPEGIDERAVRQIVTRAKGDLASLTETNEAVRRIVGAATGQRTDDAVAQAFLGRI